MNDRALKDRVYREAIDHGLDLAIVERAAIAREEIVDRCTLFEVAFAHSLSPWSGLSGPSRWPSVRDVTLSHRSVEPRAVAHRMRCCFWPHSGHSAARRIRRTEASCLRLAGRIGSGARKRHLLGADIGGLDR